MSSQPVGLERVRITRVGVVFVLLAVVVGLAAVNTGNNALYMVEAMLLSALVVSGLTSRRNLRLLQLGVEPPREVYAAQPFSLEYELVSRDRWAAKRWLRISPRGEKEGDLVPYLAPRQRHRGSFAMLIPRRGRHRIDRLRVASVFPLGIFQKIMSYRVDRDLLVFPEIFPSSIDAARLAGEGGQDPSRTVGWGHELLSLRQFRAGDDPRGIHWKQTARTGGLIFMEREAEDGRRLSILLDNAVGRLAGAAEESRFERLVSEAASAAVHHLQAGFEVELVTRDDFVPFGRGRSHQLRMLERLALIEARAASAEPLRPAARRGPELRLGFAAGRVQG
jgi:uncharacterized protein (DUF58 family)